MITIIFYKKILLNLLLLVLYICIDIYILKLIYSSIINTIKIVAFIKNRFNAKSII